MAGIAVRFVQEVMTVQHPRPQRAINAGIDYANAWIAAIGHARNRGKGQWACGGLRLGRLDQDRESDAADQRMVGQPPQDMFVTVYIAIKVRRRDQAFLFAAHDPPVFDPRRFGCVGQEHFNCGRAKKVLVWPSRQCAICLRVIK